MHFPGERIETQKMENPTAPGGLRTPRRKGMVRLNTALRPGRRDRMAADGLRRAWRQCPVGHIWKAGAFSRAGPP